MSNNSPNDKTIIDRQVADWRKEIARLQDLIAHATGQHEAQQPADVVERVARAITRAFAMQLGHTMESYLDAYETLWFRNIDIAKAALSALNNCGPLKDVNDKNVVEMPESGGDQPNSTSTLNRWPDNTIADHHDVTGKWVLHYLTDEQAAKCHETLQQREISLPAEHIIRGKIFEAIEHYAGKEEFDKLGQLPTVTKVMEAVRPYFGVERIVPVIDTKLIALLEKLSCLGNGERPGNSIGNTMAQEALLMAKTRLIKRCGNTENQPRIFCQKMKLKCWSTMRQVKCMMLPACIMGSG